MATMGSYCKAYLLRDMRAFTHWHEQGDNARKQKTDETEKETHRLLMDDDYVYLQENYVVTDSLFIDENIIFNETSDAWIDFCKQTLAFEVPVR